MPKAKKQATDKAGAPDLEQLKKDLFARAKKAGHIDQRDINDAIADTPENADVLDKLYTELADASIEVTTSVVPVVEEEPPVEMSDEWAGEDGEEVIVEDQHYLDDIADDSVRLYLREIGKIPL